MNNNEQKEVGLIRQVLQSELTWFVFIVGGLWGFVAMVILPLQQIQFEITQVSSTLLEQKVQYEQFDERLHLLEKEHAVRFR
jgi:hypothetical protein